MKLDFQGAANTSRRSTNVLGMPALRMWCAHPLFAIEEGMYIDLPEGQQIRPVHNGLTGPVTDETWPDFAMPNGDCINLASIFERSSDSGAVCQKLYVKSAKTICLRTADGAESLNMSYNPGDLPWLGLWINKSAWSGCGSLPYLNLGIEPATTPHDSLVNATKYTDGDFLDPGESKKWQLTVRLKSGVKTND